jgi:hypothetical protein
MMKKRFLPIGSILAGLLTSQTIAFLHVHLSNLELYQKLATLENAGYFIVPNHSTMQMLEKSSSAFFGGLFFTLTIGAAITIMVLAEVWLWVNIFHKNKSVLIFFFMLWAGFLVLTNFQGLSPIVSSYFLFIPLVVIISARRWVNSEPTKRVRLKAAITLAPMLLLTILWSTLGGEDLFVNIRDYLLLSNTVGIKINNFYYKYTLTRQRYLNH